MAPSARVSPADAARQVVSDLRTNRGRRLGHAIAWRARRVRNRVLRKGAFVERPAMYSVEFGPNGEQVRGAIADHGAAYGVRAMFGGGPRRETCTVHIAREEVEALGRLLAEACSGVTIYCRSAAHDWRELSTAGLRATQRVGGSFELMVVENRIEIERPHIQCSRIDVAVWIENRGAYRSAFRESDRDFAIVGRLRAPTFDRLASTGHDFDGEFPTPEQPDFPVDVVYTWVDGDDEAWRAEKERHSSGRVSRVPSRVLDDERFRSRDELKYSLRSLELFAPWIRRVHLVTADQRPPWLNLDHPKLNLVSHSDIYADESWLPTFNSSGIETQLHHIPGLSTKFLYFNDDFFLGQTCDRSDFFHSNGALKFFPTDQRAYEGDIDESSEEYIQADKNAIELLKASQKSVGRTIMCHAPYASDTDLLYEIEERWTDEFTACASSRFRSAADLRPIAFMQYHFGFDRRRAFPSSISHRYLALWKPIVLQQLESLGRLRSYKTFCINDVGLQPARTAEINEAVVRFLEAYFPSPSAYEI